MKKRQEYFQSYSCFFISLIKVLDFKIIYYTNLEISYSLLCIKAV